MVFGASYTLQKLKYACGIFPPLFINVLKLHYVQQKLKFASKTPPEHGEGYVKFNFSVLVFRTGNLMW